MQGHNGCLLTEGTHLTEDGKAHGAHIAQVNGRLHKPTTISRSEPLISPAAYACAPTNRLALGIACVLR